MNDFKGYSERLDKTLKDKLFWLDRINPDEIDVIVDFGCGNGKLLARAKKDPRFADKIFVGIDTYIEFEPQFWQNMGVPRHGSTKVFYYTHSDAIKRYIKSDRVALIFSSVLHEAYSFNTLPFKWHQVGAKYVIIRDMFFPMCEHYWPIFTGKEKLKIFLKSNKRRFYDHFSRFSIHIDMHWLQFLMKHHYTENWETEKKENYFAVDWNEIYLHLLHNNCRVLYNSDYNIPYLVQKAKNDFGVEYITPTHKSVIFYNPKTVSHKTMDLYKDRFWFMKQAYEEFGYNFLRCSEAIAYAYLWEICERIQEELTGIDENNMTERQEDLHDIITRTRRLVDEDWIWIGKRYFNLEPKGVYYGSN